MMRVILTNRITTGTSARTAVWSGNTMMGMTPPIMLFAVLTNAPAATVATGAWGFTPAPRPRGARTGLARQMDCL